MKKFNYNQFAIGPENSHFEGVESYKYLGVMMDPHLTFERHVAFVKDKTFGKLKMLGKIRKVMDQETCTNLYKSLVLPLFDYCNVVYDRLRQLDNDIFTETSKCCMLHYTWL